MASSLNETNLEKKLNTVTNTQESIQTLSLWCLHHKAHHKKIVEAWMKVLKKAKSSHRLALYYLANDVIQNSKRKGNSNYADSWLPYLKESAPYMKDEKIKPQVERIFTIWETRSVFETDLVEELKSLLAKDAKPRSNANTKLLAEFKPQKLIDRIKKYKKSEAETDQKQKQLASLKVDVTSTETLRQLKDRAHGNKFSKEFDEATSKLGEYVHALDREVQDRQHLIDALEKGETFYETQCGEAKIVANAYKNFGSRVKNLKRKLDEMKANLPSPIPSPTADAPSPPDSSEPNSPEHNLNQDNTEAVDMEMSDEEIEGGTLRLEDPDVGSPGSAPSPEGSPDGLNLSPPSPATAAPAPSVAASAVTAVTKDRNLSSVTPKLTRGSNMMTSLLDSMSGSVPASSKKSSLDSRLSNLIQFGIGQNMPDISPVIHSGLFGEQSPTLATMRASPMGNSGNDGGGTPLKDEGSGTGSATPLQDEDREASNPVRQINRLISKSGGYNPNSPLMPFKDETGKKPFKRRTWLSDQQMETHSKSTKDGETKLSLNEFLQSLQNQASGVGVSKTSEWTPPADPAASGQWYVNSAEQPSPPYDPYNTSPPPDLSSIPVPFGSHIPSTAMVREDIANRPTGYTYPTNHPTMTPPPDELSAGLGNSYGYSNNIPVKTNATDAVDKGLSPSASSFVHAPRMPMRNPSSDSDDSMYSRRNSYGYRPSLPPTPNPVDYYPDDVCGRDGESLLTPTGCRSGGPNRNPNIVELTPSLTRSGTFNSAGAELQNNTNLISVVQSNLEKPIGSLPSTGSSRTILRYNPNSTGPQPPAPPPGRPQIPVNLRNILPVETSNGKVDSDIKQNDDGYLGSVSGLVADYPSDGESELPDPALMGSKSEDESGGVNLLGGILENTMEEFSQIETVGGRRELGDVRNFQADIDVYARHGGGDGFERRPRFPAPPIPPPVARGFGYPRQRGNWDARGGFDPFFRPRFSFRQPPPKGRFPHPRPDGRRSFHHPPRY